MMPKLVGFQELDEQFLMKHALNQALIYYWDRLDVVHRDPPAPIRIDREQLLEGFWFGERSVLHIFRRDDQLRALYREETGQERKMDEAFLIDHRRRKEWGKKLLVRNYLEADSDGQYHIAWVRPLKLLRESDAGEVAADERG